MSQKKSAQALGSEKIGKLLFEYSLPAIIGMTAASAYNIIDRIFIGQGVGPIAISGLALTLPIMILGVAFGALVGAGASTLVSIRLGEKREDAASLILGNTVVLNLILSTVYSVLMLIFLDDVLYLFGASSATLPYAKEFMQIILVGNVFMHSYMGLNGIMRASGYPAKAMVTTLATVAVNLALAPLFIFVFNWGIRGAAFATVLSQAAGLIFTVFHFMKQTSFVRFRKGHFSLHADIIRDIFSIGMSSFLMNICTCMITIIVTRKLVQYGGDYAVGAYGIVNSILMFIAMTVMGLTQGMQPIAGYNYGAKQFRRSREVFVYTIIAGSCVTTFGFLMGVLLPWQIARAFTSNEELISLTVYGMRATLLMFPIVGFQMVTSNYFQSIGQAKVSIFLSLSRQVIFLIPLLLILPHFFGLKGVWAAMPAADFSASILTAGILRSKAKKIRLE
ncbi:MAG: MATE family efflux transporter [Spirochaetota bacterium]